MSGETRYCFPPVRMTANMRATFQGGKGRRANPATWEARVIAMDGAESMITMASEG